MNLKLKNTALVLFGVIVLYGNLSAQKIHFAPYDTRQWDKIRALQWQYQKALMIYVYSENDSAWQEMKNKTLKDFKVDDYIALHYINVLVNIDSAYGKEFAQKYRVNCTPAYLAFDVDTGKLFQRASGYFKPKDFLSVFDVSWDWRQPHDNRFTGFEEAYNVIDSTHPTPATALIYLKALSENCFATNDTAVSFLLRQKQADYILPDNWKIIDYYVTDVASSPFKYLIATRKDFVAKFGLDTVNEKIFYAYLNHGINLAFNEKADRDRFYAYKSEVAKTRFERSKELALMLDLTFADANENLNDYYKYAKQLANRFEQKSAAFLNRISRKLLEKSTDKKQLADALKWARQSTEIKAGWENLDTYARLIFKTGDSVKAIENEKKAIELAKADNADTTRLGTTLKSFTQVK